MIYAHWGGKTCAKTYNNYKILRRVKMDINECVAYIKEKHKGQKRKQGTPYYEHPFAVAEILKEKDFGDDYYVTGLFHDLLEDTNATEDEILKLSNKEVLTAVKLLTKQKNYNIDDYINGINNHSIAKMVKLATIAKLAMAAITAIIATLATIATILTYQKTPAPLLITHY